MLGVVRNEVVGQTHEVKADLDTSSNDSNTQDELTNIKVGNINVENRKKDIQIEEINLNNNANQNNENKEPNITGYNGNADNTGNLEEIFIRKDGDGSVGDNHSNL